MCCREFKIEDGKAVIPLGVTVQGDVLIIIYHARATLGGRLQAKVSGTMCLASALTLRPSELQAVVP
jgi:hypothetical protein